MVNLYVKESSETHLNNNGNLASLQASRKCHKYVNFRHEEILFAPLK